MTGKQNVFDGVRVVDFTWNVAGPRATLYLALHGATVIRIESSHAPDPCRFLVPFKDDKVDINRAPFFAEYNNNKYSIALDLNHSKGLEVAKRLVAWADLLAESYTPGQMNKWKLGYEDVKRIKPDIIMFSTSIQGQTGSHSNFPGFGNLLASLCGITSLLGYPGEGPLQPYGPYTDFISPRFAIAAIIAALDYRRRTGKGQYLDLSQFETSLHLIGPILMDYQINGHITHRKGNRWDDASPHNVFRCKGEDRWCAISVKTNVQWEALCQLMNHPPWTKEEKFKTLSGRKKNEDELESMIEKWTSSFDHYELMHLLQKAGVPGAAVLNGMEIVENDQLKHREHFKVLEHPEIGRYLSDGIAYRLSETPAELKSPGPCFGQHTHYVCKEILGMSEDEFIELKSMGVFE